MTSTVEQLTQLWFEQTDSAILVLQDALVDAMNPAAQALFASTEVIGQRVDRVLPGFSPSITGQQQIRGLNDEVFRARVVRQSDDTTALLILERAQETDFKELLERLTNLHLINRGLSGCRSAKEVYHYAVDSAKDYLGIDRIGILLIDPETNEFTGTYGTDEEGSTAEEFDYREPIPDSPWVAETLARKDSVAVWENMPLMQFGRQVGIGWNAMAALWDGDSAIGWIACDNLLSRRPMTPAMREVIRFFASLLAQAIIRKQAEDELQQFTVGLEKQVAERTQSLEQKIAELSQTRQKLSDAEKRAALATLVVGVAHEINTPLGAVVSNIGSLKDSSDDLLEVLQEYREVAHLLPSGHLQRIEGKEQSFAIDEIIEDFPLLVSDVRRSLKRIQAITNDLQGFSNTDEVHGNSQLDHAINGALKALDKRGFHTKVERNVPPVQLHIELSRLEQIFIQLLSNAERAIDDANRGSEGLILVEVKAAANKDTLTIAVADNGIGMSQEVVSRALDPFFTTRADGAGTGLGLSVVASLINAAGGDIEITSAPAAGSKVNIHLPGKVLAMQQEVG